MKIKKKKKFVRIQSKKIVLGNLITTAAKKQFKDLMMELSKDYIDLLNSVQDQLN